MEGVLDLVHMLEIYVIFAKVSFSAKTFLIGSLV